MPGTLSAEPFSLDKRALIVGFDCGDDSYQKELAEWIAGTDVEESLAKGTKVFLYRDDKGDVVGYGSIGETRRPWPPGQKKTSDKFSIIPAVAIKRAYWGEPKGGARESRYSSQIMNDLIARARMLGHKVLLLYVHPDNVAAIALYGRFDFVDGGEHKGYRIMTLKLAE